jgi:hypothetical protein
MKKLCRVVIVTAALISAPLSLFPATQDTKPAPKSGDAASKPAPAAAQDSSKGKQYSGMYTFLKEGEYVQVTVEDAGQVTGFISRYGDSGSGKGAFVDQFFKTGKLDGNKLIFTTNPAHAVWFEFKGVFERGEGKTPEEEAYYVLKGTLTESTTGPDKKVSSQAQGVTFKMFPQEAEAPAAKN